MYVIRIQTGKELYVAQPCQLFCPTRVTDVREAKIFRTFVEATDVALQAL